MTETLKFGEYEVLVDLGIHEVPHFCSGVYCHDLDFSIFRNGRMEDTTYRHPIFTPERLKYIVATGVARIISDWVGETAEDTNTRCVFYVANRPLEGNEEHGTYKCRYGVSGFDVWDSLPTRKHMMHAQSYDEGSEVWGFSLEFETKEEVNDCGGEFLSLVVPHDEDKYQSIHDEIMKELEAEEAEEAEEDTESLIDSILEEVL